MSFGVTFFDLILKSYAKIFSLKISCEMLRQIMQFDAGQAKLLQPGAHIIVDDCPGLRLVAHTTQVDDRKQ